MRKSLCLMILNHLITRTSNICGKQSRIIKDDRFLVESTVQRDFDFFFLRVEFLQ